jgi:5-methylcytosine-specific restriction protein A
MFVQGQVYRRLDLHNQFGGQQQGGISTPADFPIILLFTGKSGEQFGYRDDWTEAGVFLYTGEGQLGDMEFNRGNRAVRDHAPNGKDIHLFSYVRTGHVQYISQMVCIGYHDSQGEDLDLKMRRAIVFELVPLDEFTVQAVINGVDDSASETGSLEDLRQRALVAAVQTKDAVERRTFTHHRSRAVRAYVLRRADGHCEGCGAAAPFHTPAGRPYIEPHHIRRLTDGGPDHPRWVAGVCPNCHRRAHYSADSESYNNHLKEAIGKLEP